MLECFSVALFKGVVHTILAILLLLTHPHVVLNLFFFVIFEKLTGHYYFYE